MVPGWAVVRTQVQREDLARRHIADQGFRCFLPKFRRLEAYRGKRRERVLNLFPSYLFVWIERQWYSLTGTTGVSHVLMDGLTPAIVPEREVKYLMERFDENGLHTEKDGRFERGQRVRVINGPFSDQVGLFVSMGTDDRVKVLFEMLGRKTEVELGERELAAA